MASAVAKSGGKAPVAGQAGYDVFKQDDDVVQTTEQERQVTPMQPKAKREINAESAKSARKATGSDLVSYLIESGTNRDKMQWVRAWLVDNKEATAEQTFRYLHDADSFGDPQTSPGTLEKAAKWIWPETWRQELTDGGAPPQEEFDILRKRVNDLESNLASKNGEIASLHQQLQFAKEQLKDISGQNALLKKGAQSDVSGPGKNVLESAGAPV